MKIARTPTVSQVPGWMVKCPTWCHSSCRPETGTLRAIFIAPTKLKSFLHSTIQRRTLPQSRPLGVPAPSEREPGMGCAIHRTARKPQRCGRFSSPLRNVPFNRAGGQRRDWKVAIWVVASSRALSQKALSVRSIPATRAVASAVATVVVCSSFLYTGTKSGPCWRYLA